VTEDSIGHATEVVQEIAPKIAETDDLGKALRTVFMLGDQFARHSMGVVVVANWLAKQMGWTAPRVTVPLTMGALLHDIGLKELPQELVNKPRLEMTHEEVELYETHPVRGMMILRAFPGISADVLQIVQQHHEMPNGLGFPSRLRAERMFPLARVVSFANILAHDIIDTLLEKKEFSIEKLHERIDNLYKPMYGSELCKAAKAVFKLKSKDKAA
jgi:HD-GYP domain-containing protein (c-di-GMP phosphodiesterase class II)